MKVTKLATWPTLALIAWSGNAWSQHVSGCGSLENAYGPFDYTNATHVSEKLPIVERAHFTHEVEALIKASTGTIWGDLDYTLRAFPNHHRALYAVVRYALRPDSPKSTGYYPAECYLRRALAFKPDDGMVHMIYGIFLHKQEKRLEALEEYRTAVELMPDSAEAHYNLGLLYADLRQYDDARKHAERAYAHSYPLEGLRNKLREVGAWN